METRASEHVALRDKSDARAIVAGQTTIFVLFMAVVSIVPLLNERMSRWNSANSNHIVALDRQDPVVDVLQRVQEDDL